MARFEALFSAMRDARDPRRQKMPRLMLRQAIDRLPAATRGRLRRRA